MKQKQRGGRSEGYGGRSEGRGRDAYARGGKSDRGSCSGDAYTHSAKPDRREILQRSASSDQNRGNGRPQVWKSDPAVKN